MAIITVGVNSYVTEAELITYATDRGISLQNATDVLLIKAMDWLELQSFKGAKTDPAQALQWPRAGAIVNGEELEDTLIPVNIKSAQLQAAIQVAAGDDLLPNLEPRVLSEEVGGAIKVTYSDKGNQSVIFSRLNAYLRDYLSNGGSATNFNVVRG